MKRKFNENYFETIETEQQAYWLGFIMADGCILSTQPALSIHINRKDIDLLKIFVQDIDYTNKIYIADSIIKETGNIRHMCYISCRSPKLVNDLAKYGCGPNKSLTLQRPTNLDNALIPHWIRGYCDGDGCFHLDKKNRLNIKILGTYDVLQYIKQHLRLTCKITKYGKIYCVSTGGNVMMSRIGKYLYDGATRFMDRKRHKFTPLIGG